MEPELLAGWPILQLHGRGALWKVLEQLPDLRIENLFISVDVEAE